MGLDIDFFKVKSRKDAEHYLRVLDEYDDFSSLINSKYKQQQQAVYAKHNEWYDKEIAKQEADENYEIAWDNAPDTDVTAYASKEDIEQMQKLREMYQDIKKSLGVEYDKEIKDLYMRKKNWMVYFVQSRHHERLEHNDDYGEILKGSTAVLDKNDIHQLVKKMRKVLKGFKDYEEVTGKKTYKEDGWISSDANDWISAWQATDEQVQTAQEELPTMSRFFFGSTDYDYWYFSGIKYYLSKFEELLKTMTDDEALVYVESW